MLKARGDGTSPPRSTGRAPTPCRSDNRPSITNGVTEGSESASRRIPASQQAPVPGTSQALIPSHVVLGINPVGEPDGPPFTTMNKDRNLRSCRTKDDSKPTDRERTDGRPTHSHKYKTTRQDGETRGESD